MRNKGAVRNKGGEATCSCAARQGLGADASLEAGRLKGQPSTARALRCGQRSTTRHSAAQCSVAHLTWPPGASRSLPPPRAIQTPRTRLQGRAGRRCQPGVRWLLRAGRADGASLGCAAREAGGAPSPSIQLRLERSCPNTAALSAVHSVPHGRAAQWASGGIGRAPGRHTTHTPA